MSFWSKLTPKHGKKPSLSEGSAGVNPSNRVPPPLSPLRDQHPTPADAATKIRLSILATALVDALGGPPEFHKRFTFDLVTTMMPNENFDLPAGVWTDDTSMTLCLARSIATYVPVEDSGGFKSQNVVPGGFDERHQLDAYTNWHRYGRLSAIGYCFDIGNTIGRALRIYQAHGADGILARIEKELGADSNAGNGSLMRVLPVGLTYWRDTQEAAKYARRSSATTHPTAMCLEACEMWTQLIALVVYQSSLNIESEYSKLNLLDYIAKFPYTNEKLRNALVVPAGTPPCREDEDLEEYYRTHHPILSVITETQLGTPIDKDIFPYSLPSAKQILSSGYVLHTLIAALYCFFATTTFEHGAIMAVNLGDDADTVGAVYGGLAGCWYAGYDDNVEGVFWTKRVREWRKTLVKRSLVQEVAEEVVQFSERLGKSSQ
ncbi:ADP-ribosylglycohydrolase-domain-containing protein [Crucibulum laeve]|uniref:ADP-ribosylhydrolase ARH3 n=1 Tax=Crucibulum laeve TaxID=68775 RepID=A0A5C3M5Z2_9AGAR|nr:ADP-ribosylglycohydrolase-domain-containing protein [Crucibulum laeve]